MRSCNKHDLELLAHIDASIIHNTYCISHFITSFCGFFSHFSLMGWHFEPKKLGTQVCVCVFTFKGDGTFVCWTFLFNFYYWSSFRFFFNFLGCCYFWSNYLKQDPKVQRCWIKSLTYCVSSLKLVRIEFWFKLMSRTTQIQLPHSSVFFE